MKKDTLSFLLLLLLCSQLPMGALNVRKAVSMKRWHIPAANYSGITHLGGDRYAVVSDKEAADGYYEFTIRLNPLNGKVERVERSSFRANPHPETNEDGSVRMRDTEGVAYHPVRKTLFISGEKDQQVLEYDLTGCPTGFRLDIPAWCSPENIHYNRGFEALTYDSAVHRFYAMTESQLREDGPLVSEASPREPQTLRLLVFDDRLKYIGHQMYRMEPATVKHFRYYYTYGVSAVTPLPNGKLLVLEREINIPRKAWGGWVSHHLFVVNPRQMPLLTDRTDKERIPASRYLAKRLLYQFTTRLRIGHTKLGNYEGMCLGPPLKDGRRPLLLLNDSQEGAGNALYHLKDYIKVILLDGSDW